MKKRYQIDQQRAVQQFRRLATFWHSSPPSTSRLNARPTWRISCGCMH
jgi:hypothetical protein